MKDLKDLKNAKILSKMEQRVIKGGFACVEPEMWCPPGSHCVFNRYGGICRRD